MRVAVRDRRQMHERAGSLQRLDDRRFRLAHVLPGNQRRGRNEHTVRTDRIVDRQLVQLADRVILDTVRGRGMHQTRSEEHTSELQSLMRISYAVFCLKKKTKP